VIVIPTLRFFLYPLFFSAPLLILLLSDMDINFFSNYIQIFFVYVLLLSPPTSSALSVLSSVTAPRRSPGFSTLRTRHAPPQHASSPPILVCSPPSTPGRFLPRRPLLLSPFLLVSASSSFSLELTAPVPYLRPPSPLSPRSQSSPSSSSALLVPSFLPPSNTRPSSSRSPTGTTPCDSCISRMFSTSPAAYTSGRPVPGSGNSRTS
jgi:hypothetical protein